MYRRPDSPAAGSFWQEKGVHMHCAGIFKRLALSVLLHVLGMNSLREQLSQTQPAVSRLSGGRAILAAHLVGARAKWLDCPDRKLAQLGRGLSVQVAR